MTLEEKLKAKISERIDIVEFGDLISVKPFAPHISFDNALIICQEAIDDACKRQREICRREYFTTITRAIQPIIHQGLENAPSPTEGEVTK